jgi:hypothetical protein
VDPVPIATSLARALLTLSRSGAQGVLEVWSEQGRAQIAILGGTPRAIRIEDAEGFADETLGDALVRSGALDGEGHLRAIEDGAIGDPIGTRLIRAGAATAAAVSHALRDQMRRRVARMLGWPAAEYRFVPGRTDVGVALLDEPVRAADLVLGALRERLATEPALRARRRLGDGMMVLTTLGDALITDAALWPDEAAMIPALRRGAAVDVALAAAHGSTRALRLLVALRWLGAIAPPSAGDATYATLLRKKRQLDRSAPAHTLLDLPKHSPPAAARQALRRLAVSVHPDRFGTETAPALTRASNDVMTALVHAERSLRR